MYVVNVLELKGGQCFNLKFREPKYKDKFISVVGVHSQGSLKLKISFDENEPVVKINEPFIGLTKSSYEIQKNIMTVNVNMRHDEHGRGNQSI